ncbi:hypothetical protein [Lutibacter flavus]|nr:hypothetical protein [Lutibacter flavus]
MKNTNKLVTYSLLAQINSKVGAFSKIEDVFKPLIKRSIHELNSKGINKGKDIFEIKKVVDELFGLDIPIPLLDQILRNIAQEINNQEQVFKLNKDGSFEMQKYIFSEVDEEMDIESKKIKLVEDLYDKYLLATNYKGEKISIVEFVDLNKLHLSSYFSSTKTPIGIEGDFNHEKYVSIANFLNDLKENPDMFKILRQVYLGSVLASYLEYDIENINIEMELLLDTSFLLGILNLKSEQAFHTCSKIWEIGKKMNFKFSILPITIEELRNLLEMISRNLDDTFIERYVDPESIYSACHRRNLNKTDLDRITSKIEKTLKEKFKFSVIGYDKNLRSASKINYPKIYKKYIDKGKSNFSALHDTCSEVYVIERRTKKVSSFIEAQAWFVIYGHNFSNKTKRNGYLPAAIRAEELVNILWLSNPMVKETFKSSEFASLGITRLISTTLSDSLPTSKVLRQLDNNIQKYSKQNITAEDCVLAASKIAEKRENEIIDLNLLAETNSGDFISKINEFAEEKRLEDQKWKDSIYKTVKDIQNEVNYEKIKVKQKEIDSELKDDVIGDNQNKISYLNKQNKLLEWFVSLLIIFIVSAFVFSFDSIAPTFKLFPNIKVKLLVVLLSVCLSLLIPLKKHRLTLLISAVLPIIMLIISIYK